MQCANNLKQLGLATHNFHDANGALPTQGADWADNGTIDGVGVSNKSVALHLLPYLEQGNAINISNITDIRAIKMKPMLCPARPVRVAVDPGTGKDVVMGDYACLSNSWDLTWQSTANTRCVIVKAVTGTMSYNGHMPGVNAKRNPTVNLAGIPDGSSNTVLFGDKKVGIGCAAELENPSWNNPGYNVPPMNTAYAWWEIPGWAGGYDWVWMKSTEFPPLSDLEGNYPSSWGAGPCIQVFGGRHPAGINVVMCDGSVQFIRYGITTAVWRALGIRDDGIVTDSSSF
jgi:prepilin-type processing-associated H-X9-DG protein